MNGEYILGNPLLNVAQPTTFAVGADLATSSAYLVGKPISFDIDERYFPSPYAQAQNPFGLPIEGVGDIPRPSFRWDFKDGSLPQEGKNVSHVFTKPGTYIVDIAAKFEGKSQDFTSVNTVQLSVMPNAQYEFATPKISVDGMVIEDKLRDAASIRPAKPVVFEVKQEDESIQEYLWDFGDEKGAKGQTVKHRFARDSYFPVTVLRAVDKYGIFTDTYVLLNMPFERPNIFVRIWYFITDLVSGVFYKE
jgi:hypothetical protein